MSIGDEACLLSHCKTLNEFLSTSYPAALILEDDAEVTDDVPGCLQSTDWWPRTTGLLQLSIFSEKVRLVGSSIGQTPCGRSLHPILSMNGSAAGYLIDRETAQIVLNACTVPTMPIDHLLFSMKWSPLARRLKPVQINPAMVRQKYSVFASDIAPSRDREHEGWKISRKKMKIWNRRLYKTRVFGLRILGKASRIRIHYSDAHDLDKIVKIPNRFLK